MAQLKQGGKKDSRYRDGDRVVGNTPGQLDTLASKLSQSKAARRIVAIAMEIGSKGTHLVN